jgi:hypothetical protein
MNISNRKKSTERINFMNAHYPKHPSNVQILIENHFSKLTKIILA